MPISCSYDAEGNVIFTDAIGTARTVPPDWPGLFRQADVDGGGVVGFLDAGGTVIPYAAPPAVLPDLVPYQFRAMLALSDKQAALDAFVAALPDPQKTIAQAKLDYSLSFQRDNELVVSARQALGLTDAELDALWLEAAAIT